MTRPSFTILGSRRHATRCLHQPCALQDQELRDTLPAQAIMARARPAGPPAITSICSRDDRGDVRPGRGYKGTADFFLAMERGEVDGNVRPGLGEPEKSQRPDWVRNKTAKYPRPDQSGAGGRTGQTGYSQIWKFMRSEDDKKAVELIIASRSSAGPISHRGRGRGATQDPARCRHQTIAGQGVPCDAERARIDVARPRAEMQRSWSSLRHAEGDRQRAKDSIKP